MKLQEKIKADIMTAMKNKDENTKSLLRVVSGEISRIGKDVSDDDVIKIISKMKENASEMGNANEMDILNKYLPVMLEPKQLEILIKGIITKNSFEGMKDMGKVMKELRDNYGSTYDGKLASEIVKNNL
jgi:uncharacterized protein YqeY